MNTTLYLIRHGEIDNPQGIVYGRTEMPLSPDGRQQIRNLAETLKQRVITPDVIISSSLVRAVQSADEIKEVFPTAPIILKDDLQETDCGRLTGELMSKAIAIGDIYHADECKDMGIEQPEEIVKRMRRTVLEAKKTYPGKVIFLVSHGDPLAFLLRNLLDPNEPLPTKPDLEAGKYLAKGEAWRITLDEENRVREFEIISGKEEGIAKERES